jgi:hypothetical protein
VETENFYLQYFHVGYGHFLEKATWLQINGLTVKKDFIQCLAVRVLQAGGEDPSDYSYSGKYGPGTSNASAKKKIPEVVIEICKRDFPP